MKKTFFTIIALILTTTLFAQIPNAGFESWNTTAGYNNPDNWDNLNSITSGLSLYTCTKGTPGNPGSSYIKLTSLTTGAAVIPGVAVSGKINVANPLMSSGFPFTQRPQTFDGNWQYMAYGNDAGFISVLLSKWNSTTHSRDTVASYYGNLSGMVMSWASFSKTLVYKTTDLPDSCLIVLSAGKITGGTANSYLYVDNLAFTGSVPGGSGISDVSCVVNDLNIYPNPINGVVNLVFSNPTKSALKLQLISLDGKLIKEFSTINSIENKISFNTNNLPSGTYILNISNGKSTQSKQIVIQ